MDMETSKKLPSSPVAAWPIILRFIKEPGSAIDFGCGTGHWLAGLQSSIPTVEVIGINEQARADAGHFLRADQFRYADLRETVDFKRKFDLAVCVEVAEHLPESAADTLVRSITRHSDVVVFSAGIPHQDPTHENEQWPDYWIKKFAEHDFNCFDCLRPAMWNNQDISVWYRQNIMLFMKEPQRPLVDTKDWEGAAVVHPQYFEWAHMKKARTVNNLKRFLLGKPLF